MKSHNYISKKLDQGYFFSDCRVLYKSVEMYTYSPLGWLFRATRMPFLTLTRSVSVLYMKLLIGGLENF